MIKLSSHALPAALALSILGAVHMADADTAHTGHHAHAGHPAPAASSSPSPYVGEETRGIKALAPEQIAGLRAGRGMGYGRAAELNGYPGPMHVLELAQELRLTDDQITATREIRARMQTRAQAVGSELVEAEAELDRLFRTGIATQATLKAALERIGRLQAEVRGAHLQAHIEQHAVLTPEQVERYGELRGYGKRSTGRRGPALHPDSLRKEDAHGPGKEGRERKGRTDRTKRGGR